MMELLRAIATIEWEAKVGDPTVLAWLTVVGYLVASAGCSMCAIRAERIFDKDHLRLHRILWWGMSTVLLILAINKQLDLHNLFTAVMKTTARHYGIFEKRRILQVLFIAGLGTVCLGALGWVAWQVRREWRRYVFWLLGGGLLILFVLVRVSRFYGFPIPRFSLFPQGISRRWLVELFGILTLGLSAFLNLYHAKKKKKSSN